MGEKSRLKFAALIALILAAAVAYSFTFNLFEAPPSVSLASGVGVSDLEQDGEDSSSDAVIQVGVTPETVQSVILTLSRYRSYSRTLQIEYLEEGMVKGSLSAVVAVDSGWTRVDVTSKSGVEHTIVGNGMRYRWYNNEKEYASAPAREGSGDLAQMLPTYEDVLDLDTKNITAAGYESRGGVACIYVEVEESALGYLERYWISVESGLLVSAETIKMDEVVYRMTSYQVESPLVDGEESFLLPDGTLLHQVED